MAEVEAQNGAKNGSENGVKVPAVTFSSFKPQLTVETPKVIEAVQFYKSAFGAEEIGRTTHPKRKIDQEHPLILSAEFKLGSSVFSVASADGDATVKSGSDRVFCLETEEVEAAISQAVTAGAKVEAEVDTADGEGRFGTVKDPYGFVWKISFAAGKTAEATVEV